MKFHGPYEPGDVDRLMRRVDLTVIPSIWWENSPVVIQEAFRNRRPVVHSDIGGMAEKIRDGMDGWQFPVGSAPALAALLTRLSADRGLISEVSSSMRQPLTVQETVAAHLALYRGVIESKEGQGSALDPPRAERPLEPTT